MNAYTYTVCEYERGRSRERIMSGINVSYQCKSQMRVVNNIWIHVNQNTHKQTHEEQEKRE